ncbi:N-acetyl-gamma-glutamyl-phosphate reductase 2 [Philodulcilactobacillus myokoensis]|uniref:N-acetyl-gamma-glutamyl-phosphate reductase n=2 Tax=Philodulcilactobacillus myokoensis TaxID=2929573 RepID=A0A9W6B1Z0_9LACO|nr:N-acetyl-gamma-glutamyl-phosphate reductase [Philodulcilactobacillus myokoensis]GLB47425.1 N-acetyl-gamma-glutamyl-phosphate reductase 2 [Philodulcilactobacillus myokoensis]
MEVAIIGITGYAGTVLYELLTNHPQISQINLYAHNLTQSTPLGKITGQFSFGEQIVYPYDAQQIMENNDVVFFATPAGVTSKLAQPFLKQLFPVIDLSGDFRLNDPKQYEKWYQKPAANEDELKSAYYGLADLQNNDDQKYVANPGCYATSILLGLAPLVQNDLIQPDSILIDAKSGFSGAGKKLTTMNHFVNAHDNLQIYKPNQHKHIPEIMQKLKEWNQNVDYIQFMTTVVPMNRGIMSSIYVQIKPKIRFQNIQDAFKTCYQNSPFVFTTPNLPTVKEVVGTNECHLGFSYNPKTNYLLVDSVIDNMIKGAAGQAIQNLNQLFHFSITDGLKLTPTLP